MSSGKGRLKFQGTVISDDSVEGPDDLKKVLGQWWNRILVDVKVNYRCKKKGAKIKFNRDLEATEDSMPQLINMRIVWQVAQCQ
jgi:hypothetical protein